ncbi:outer membrane beta-barrel protein [bacterium]|nr:outer membrane beta-barrel protein [bacterium]
MKFTTKHIVFLFGVFFFLQGAAFAQDGGRIIFTDPKTEGDEVLSEEDLRPRRHSWGADLMIGNDGFGLGFFYGYAFSDVLSSFANLSLSEAKDERQKDFYNPWTGQYSPNKTHYVFRIPLFLGLQYRLFKEEIVDNFRPFINGGAGPVMLYVSPADPEGDFLSSLGGGTTHYTFGGFLGAGAQFGFDRSSVLGVNVRYYIIPVPDGVSSVVVGDENAPDGRRPVQLANANGFYIALNFGTAF